MTIQSKKIGVFQLVLLSVSAIVSLRSLPLFAEMGVSIVFFLGIATVCFFIPISMAIAELSSTWPLAGGCYAWIKKAYGKSWAFYVMWAYWMESILWFPTMLIFIVAMLAHSLSPFYSNLESNKFFLVCGIVSIFWVLTFINFYGVRVSTAFSTFGVFFGTVLPICLIIFFGIYWYAKGEELNIVFSFSSVFPMFDFNNLVFFSGILLGISGIEIIAFYVNDVENPKTSIAKSVLISSFFILFVYVIGSLSVAMVVPKTEICLASGVVQALKIFFVKINMSFIVPFLAFLLLLGSLSGMNTWILGPARGLFVTAEDGFLPKFLSRVNSKNVPVNLLVVQAFVGSTLSVVFFLYVNSINGLIWIFVCLSFQFASFLYIMIFFSTLKLRKMYPDVYRPYKVPCVKIFSYLGISICIFTFFISYVQPSDINITNKGFYSFLLFFSFIFLMLPAFFLVFIKSFKKV